MSTSPAAIAAARDLAEADDRTLAEGSHDELAERVRQLAKRDPAVTANVLRMWLQDARTEVPKT